MGRGSSPMASQSDRPARRITWRAPVIVMVLAATMIPVELRPLDVVPLACTFEIYDFVENMLGYVPVGIVLASMGALWAVGVAALMSMLAEAGQFAMMHRDPSAMDVAANVLGAMLGVVVSARWKIRSPGFRLGRWKALVAALLAVALLLGAWSRAGVQVSARGLTAPGTLEAYWKLDERGGRSALDSSGHGLDGTFRGAPKRVAGMRGGAVALDGAKDYIDFGRSTTLRLAGSMTISAWINSTVFPRDDAAIVSSHNPLGYQLDTTVDKGPRTVGFKLADSCGQLMARYGRTPLALNTWYHVVGVYDAEARTLDVYVNGELDNGELDGSVTGRQTSSREAVFVGRRSNTKGFEFAGIIDDVHIYSRALTPSEIVAEMQGKVIDAAGGEKQPGSRGPEEKDPACAAVSEYGDSGIPGAAAVVGVLVAVAMLGLWPSAGPLPSLAACVAAGFLLLPAMASNTPLPWLMPLVSLLGGASVWFSLDRRAGH
jgi:VanZ family protein